MKYLKREDLGDLVGELRRLGYSVYGPKKVSPGGDFFFVKVNSFDEMDFEGFVNTLYPPKFFFFPQEERLLRLKGLEVDKRKAEEKKALFGIRPCDVEGLVLLDKFYLEGFMDPWYEARRKDTLIVTFSCFNPLPTCFCIEAKAGPWAKRGFDLQVHDLGDFYLVEAGSTLGEEFISSYPDASDKDIAFLNAEREKTLNKFKKRPYAESKLHKFSLDKEDRIWKKLGNLCFHCGGCTYLCPTCSCYNMFDVVESNGVWRVREWDSCLLTGYHRMAGDNPKPDISSRMHFHMECKLSPEINEKYGRIACTGCGRCLLTCIGDAQIESLLLLMEERNE